MKNEDKRYNERLRRWRRTRVRIESDEHTINTSVAMYRCPLPFSYSSRRTAAARVVCCEGSGLGHWCIAGSCPLTFRVVHQRALLTTLTSAVSPHSSVTTAIRIGSLGSLCSPTAHYQQHTSMLSLRRCTTLITQSPLKATLVSHLTRLPIRLSTLSCSSPTLSSPATSSHSRSMASFLKGLCKPLRTPPPHHVHAATHIRCISPLTPLSVPPVFRTVSSSPSTPAQSTTASSSPPTPLRQPDNYYRTKLTPLQYAVSREADTERPGTGPLLHNKHKGTYTCVSCGTALFDSSTKFESGTGWPSFYDKLGENVKEKTDHSLWMKRVEVLCAACDGHLGHVFEDGPRDKTGLRYCINSASLGFVPAGEKIVTDPPTSTQ